MPESGAFLTTEVFCCCSTVPTSLHAGLCRASFFCYYVYLSSTTEWPFIECRETLGQAAAGRWLARRAPLSQKSLATVWCMSCHTIRQPSFRVCSMSGAARARVRSSRAGAVWSIRLLFENVVM